MSENLVVFRSNTVLSHLKKFQVSCIDTYKGQLLVGGNDGSLRKFELIDEKAITYHESKYIPHFASKEIEMMSVVDYEKEHFIISLVDGYIYVHSLPNFELITKIEQSKGAYTFALNRGPNHDTTLDPKFASFLCLSVAVRRRVVMVFNWDASTRTFSHKVDLSIPDYVISMDWVGRWICLGFNKKEYNLIHLSTGNNKSVFPVGKKSSPVSLVLPKREILLSKDNLGICVDYDGKPTRQDAIIWSEPPIKFSYSHPYVIGLLSSCVEVRNIHTRTLVQTFPIKDSKYVTIQGPLFIANNSSIIACVPISLLSQIDMLMERKAFKDALDLVTTSLKEDWKCIQDKYDKINQINLLYAYELFNRGDYQSSMMYFQQTDCNPRQVLSLFPDVLPSGQQANQYQHPVPTNRISGEENLLHALSALIPFLEMMRGRLLLQKNTQNELMKGTIPGRINMMDSMLINETDEEKQQMPLPVFVDTVLLKAYLLTNEALVMAFLQQGNQCDIEKSQIVLKAYSKFRELVSLYHSRGEHLAALELLASQGQGTPSGQLYGTEPTVTYLQELSETSNNVEHVKLVLQFSKWILAVNPEDGLRIFTHCHDINKQLKLQGKNNNEYIGISPFIALEHLKKTSDRDLCIKFLESLLNTGESSSFFHNELVFLYLDGVTSLLGIVNAGQDDDNMIQSVSTHIKQQQQQAKHDQHNNNNQQQQQNNNDNKSIEKQQQIQQLQEKNKSRIPAGKEPGRLGILRQKLINFLKDSIHYNAEKMLSWFPRDELLEERAILLSRIQQHVQALTIYAHKLGDSVMAEEYCEEHHNEDHNMYLELLKVYLQPPDDLFPRAEPLVEPALQLLSKYYEYIDAAEAIRILPDNTSVKKLMPFFRNMLTCVKHKRRTNQIRKNLLTADHRCIHLTNLQYSKPSIILDENTVCRKCSKKIGAHSAFARYPDNSVIHYVCFTAAEETKKKVLR